MENREHFGALTERMQAFREAVLDEKPYIDAERALLATEAYKAHQNQPNVMKRALMLQNILASRLHSSFHMTWIFLLLPARSSL